MYDFVLRIIAMLVAALVLMATAGNIVLLCISHYFNEKTKYVGNLATALGKVIAENFAGKTQP